MAHPYDKKEEGKQRPFDAGAWGPAPKNITTHQAVCADAKKIDKDFFDENDPVKVIETQLVGIPSIIKDDYTPPISILEKNAEVDKVLEGAFKDFTEKYNITGVSYINFKESLKNISEISGKDTEFIRLVTSKTASAVAEQSILKIIVTISKLIDRSISLVLAQAMGDSSLFSTNVAILATRELFEWTKSLEELKRKYGIIGIEQSFKNMSDDTKKIENKQLSIDHVRALADKIMQKNQMTEDDDQPTN